MDTIDYVFEHFRQEYGATTRKFGGLWLGLASMRQDDEADSRELVAFVLEQADATVTSVSSGIKALQTIAQPKFDLVISYIGMPEMDGYLLMQQLRTLPLPTHQNSQIPAIALTAYAGEYDQRQAISAGFGQHISKPVAPEALVRNIVASVQRNADD